ncbi:MAG: multifunctional oxoglutarate decarboxylase/oxoglutarate dehydrogenase thiamine pyrophosphate-binding subunit/dihydrolipoyllysine-residue succinyltransferase subunit, partial [Actinobacteria bacterium]|nr:multifunctional oxoglutarate decarboxylase/oxoglutarate dehydrogenase thiamine pyrophosphate-binding subunit/dihydrolipoyllysine-residue succinyltransferase subunit [Actinomycetota bacterium]
MYERFLADPQSVDKAWWDFFSDFTPAPGGSGSTPKPNAPRAGTPPVPKSAQKAAQVAPVVPVAAPVVPVATPAPVVTPTPAAVAPSQPVVREVKQGPATPADPVVKPVPVLVTPSASTLEPIRGVSARVVQSMEASLSVPTATSVRAIPAKLMIDNRIVINNHLKRARGGKVSFTHIIGYAMIKALRLMPEMNAYFGELDGKPAVGHPEHINLGIAIDLAKADGSRQLLVPSIKGCEELDFAQFWSAYEDVVRKARNGNLAVEDFAGTTVSLTNPGTIGTVHSVPRLVQGQGLIIGVGALDYPAEFQGASEETLSRLAISKVVTLTSTYDHRVIQ